MAWQDEMIVMLRVIINDLDESPAYSDGRLEELLVVSAHLVVQEVDFPTNTYSVSISGLTITPDPSSLTSTDGTEFMNFVVMKAACLTDQSTLRTKAALAGLRARLGPASLDTLQHLEGFKQLLLIGPCAAFQTMKDQWMFGNANICKAILSPFVSNDFDPASLGGYEVFPRERT